VRAPPGPGLRQRAALQLPLGTRLPHLGLGAPQPLDWSPAHDSAIQMDETAEMWNAGHVNAIVAYGPCVLVGSDTSGVWLINPAFDAIPEHESFPALPLSWTWGNPQIAAMASLADSPEACFVGSGNGPGSPLRVLALGGAPGWVDHTGTTSIPVPCGMPSVNSLLVLRERRSLVVGGPGGVMFSAIPADPSEVSGYAWHWAIGLGGHGVSGLAEGPGESILAAIAGDGVEGSAVRGVFRGHFSTGVSPQLSFVSGALPTPAPMQRTSVATCAGDRSVGYAVATGPSDGVEALLRTDDGGATWAPLTPPDAGNQGWWNNCIDVHPDDAETVAFGWRGGPFVSRDGGESWVDRNAYPMHSDVHGVTFALAGGEVSLWAATDGGIFHSLNLGASWDSRWNRHLRNIEFYNWQSALDACPSDPAIYAGATQDNGNLYCAPSGLAWQALRLFEGGDGGTTTILPDRSCLHRNNTLTSGGVEFGNHLRRSPWQSHEYAGGYGVEVPADGYSDGLPYPAISRVPFPSHRLQERLILAVAGRDRSVWAYLEPQGGDDGHFVKVVTGLDKRLSTRVSVAAVASMDGSDVLIGLSDGALLRAAIPSGAPSSEAGTPFPAPVYDFDVTHAAAQYLLLANGTIYRKRVGSWEQITTLGRAAAGIAAHPEYGQRLYAAADDGVWVSFDGGDHWTVQSRGLPTFAQARRLCFTPNDDGWRLLLSTYGWSVFEAEVSSDESEPTIPELTPEEAEILFGIINDGDGVEILGGRLVRVPPRGPARERALLFGALVLARQLGKRGKGLRKRVLGELDQT